MEELKIDEICQELGKQLSDRLKMTVRARRITDKKGMPQTKVTPRGEIAEKGLVIRRYDVPGAEVIIALLPLSERKERFGSGKILKVDVRPRYD